jgi:hypothetical protein
MFIECLIMRDGATPVIVGNVKYMFMPLRNGGKKGPVTSICEVNAEEHLQYFKKYPKTFREYIEGQELPDGLERKVIDLSRFAIEKTISGNGYIVIKKAKKNHKGDIVEKALYSGSGGEWVQERDVASRNPFDTEFSAYQWIREEADVIGEK